jgi:hypothetical protein
VKQKVSQLFCLLFRGLFIIRGEQVHHQDRLFCTNKGVFTSLFENKRKVLDFSIKINLFCKYKGVLISFFLINTKERFRILYLKSKIENYEGVPTSFHFQGFSPIYLSFWVP